MASGGKYGSNVQVIGVTGGVGSGKSAVLASLARMGCIVVKSDDLAHYAILPGTPAYRRIVEHFGKGILTEKGTVDRGRLADIVFRDRAELAVLNRIVHPPVLEQLRRTFEEIASCGERARVAVELPLLVEAGLVDLVDAVVLVTAPREERIRRMIGQGWPESRVVAVMRAQAADAEKAKYADAVIDNGGTLAELDEKVARALDEVAGGSCVG
ncbi:MAG: dephospho-CoA kinase [Actinobacteria bacterium]|nr:MAG: dephospho-CoA kinase [Actinomycetota bacterium]